MPGKIAIVDFSKCNPMECADGVCPAAKICPRKILRQEKPGQPPMTAGPMCRGCADCVRACPRKAIRVVTQ